MPKISVLMPLYNTKEKHLREAIESILGQTFKDFEFIVLNDSPNNTALDNIVQSYKDDRIRYYKNEINLGISESRNKLLELAKGEYIAIADHDDISLPKRLELENNYLDKHLDIGVVSCNFQFMNSKVITNYPLKNIDIKEALLSYNCLLHTGMLIRKSVLVSSNTKYESLYSPAEDYMLCIRLMNFTMFANIPEVLVHYRDDDDNTTNIHKEKMIDADLRCKCVATQYTAFKDILSSTCFWLYIFKYIPLLKIKKDTKALKVYLFGLIPVFSIIKRGKRHE